MKIVVLASGSEGNCTYVESKGTVILIDCGLSMRQVNERLISRGIELKKIDAVIISHEHNDHVKALEMIYKHYKPIVYINKKSFNAYNKNKNKKINTEDIRYLNKEERYDIDDLSIVPIELSHDTANCFGFIIKELNVAGNQSMAIVTDTGYIDPKYYTLLSLVKVLIFESNHDVEMLIDSNRPWDLIQRILSQKGHLSNDESSKLLKQIVSKNTKCVILAHLSRECNMTEHAYNAVEKVFDQNIPFSLMIASQYVALEPIDTELIND